MSDESLYKEDDASKLAGELFSGKLAVGDALAKLRTRLLDLSMRNRLLNYKHPKGRSLQVVDSPDLNLLFERLEEGKSVALLYVPDPPMRRYEGGKKPEARIYARELDIGTTVDIAPSTEATTYRRLPGLQVLQYPADLEKGVRKISSEARTVIEETGTNMLYLMFGFLEYFDSEDSEKAVHAPLLSMPVNLVRGKLDDESRTYLYELSHSGEDIAENFTLREKFRQQFRLELPELGEEDTPEDYFSKIQAAVSKRRNWTVRRRLSLGFLSFGKLAIWADLDPAKSQGLLSSELLRNIFEGGRVEASGAFHAEDYDIDGHDDGELPLIYDADSSQHSALIDVKSGKSLVINGPPGTGKSQTITNIIASAIAGGKKVLFVSEKLAALEVVKQRLEKAKLGDFCLELHSHKTQKKQLLESVEQRMTRRYLKPSGYESHVSVLREKRKALNSYSALLGSTTGNSLDLSVHTVFWVTERKRQHIEDELDAVAGISIQGADGWDASQLDKCRMVLSDAANALDELHCPPQESPWLGFQPGLLIKGDELPILRTVEQALVHAGKAESATCDLGPIFDGSSWTIRQLNDALNAVETLSSVPSNLEGELLESMFVDGASSAERVRGELLRLSSLLEGIRGLRRRSVERLTHQQPTDMHQFKCAVQEGWPVLTEEALSRPPSEVLSSGMRLKELLERLTKLASGRELHQPRDVENVLRRLASVAGNVECSQWMLTPGPELIAIGTAASRTVRDVHTSLDQVASVLKASGVPFAGRTEELQSLLDGRGMPELLPEAVLDDALLEELRRLNSGGWGDWTAEQFAATARETSEVVAGASQAADELKTFFSRLGIPIEVSKSWLDSIEVLLSVMESAPRELLPLRGPGLERTDFADIAIRAEDSYKSIAYKASKVTSAFHLDTLPEEESLRIYVQTFRRGDSLFNVFRSDWRRAKNAFKGTTKHKKNASSEVMSEHFSAVLSWKASQREFCANEQFKSVMGPLFNGMETDFTKARRIHEWIRTGTSSLLTTEAGQHINLVSIPEQHILLIAGSSAKVKGWVSKLHRLSQLVHSLPGIDPALARVRRIDELFTPLDQYGNNLSAGAALLKGVVRPTGSVKRAQELVELRRRISEHSDLLRALIQAPNQLAQAGATLGLSSSPLSYQNLREAVTHLQTTTDAARALGECVSLACGESESPQSTLNILQVLVDFNTSASTVLSSNEVPMLGSLHDWIDTRSRQLAALCGLVEPLIPAAKSGVSTKDAVEAIQSGIEATRVEASVASDQSLVRLLGGYLRGEATDESQLLVCLTWGSDVFAVSQHLPDGVANRLLQADSKKAAPTVARLISDANSAIKSYHQTMSNIEKWGELDWTKWDGAPTPADAKKRLERALAAGEALVPWSKYLAACNEADPLGVGELIQQVANGSLKSSSLVQAFDYVFFKTLSRGVLSNHRELAKFTGSGHERLRTEFAKLDKELIALNGEMYAYKVDSSKRLLQGVSSGRVGDLTEMALLTKETKKQKRHIPIRQLLRRAGRSLLELKPCFMMGPLSVAQYLEQGYLQFDLVVMDEASQLRPEDALGALARGKQLVVVGDPKQLPPTNFFGRLMEDDNEDPDAEPAIVDGVESILGICEHLYRPVRTLRWHYRSQHESLIAFSNSQFYDGRLVVFPSPYKRNRRLGVNYRYVREGIYQDRRNIPEAQRVVDAVFEHMLSCPEESLGVVTLNQTQRELIEDLLDKKLRNFPGAAEYLDRHEKAGWGFFVKNLENVQGDERDVIFVSTTFGKPPDGSAVRQNFGPINRPDGWRRLNVLFTRARRRIDLFTSMLPTDVVVDEKVSLGRKALREYLEFAQTGLLPSVRGVATGREADSDFEIAVADALRNRGYETESQVGVAGYFVDLGVRHPERRGEFLAGVECDGVTYHSSLSARDRDRIRQEVLESLGWRGRIIRVWSTDWFTDPVGQTDRLVGFLEHRLDEDAALPAPFSDEDLEELTSADEQLAENLEVPRLFNDTSLAGSGASSPTDLFVELGDRVTYEVVADPFERHTVQIVDSSSNLRLGLLNEATPLAQALLGLCVGDESVLRVDKLPARTLRILSIEKQSVDEGV
ncbi:DUF4011 domain-containing protein [Hydrogenophaga sp. SL48]|uniref:DUF4011 domain-containing protein n=1 Tax=Hydrogenophaga sp. SL48 TaxID=2806347 RepID=UPI001F36110E|nr:DUF4011 domain-containing protein [Hydrogenophaga sp. SL48]UJW79447.1 DUF4011 domain-containing protein [Hydrogenophaga sp. SL48]